MTTPNYGWPTPADTDFVKDGAAAIRDLGDAADATVADQLRAWAGGASYLDGPATSIQDGAPYVNLGAPVEVELPPGADAVAVEFGLRYVWPTSQTETLLLFARVAMSGAASVNGPAVGYGRNAPATYTQTLGGVYVFTGLTPGSYTFRVQGSTSAGLCDADKVGLIARPTIAAAVATDVRPS